APALPATLPKGSRDRFGAGGLQRVRARDQADDGVRAVVRPRKIENGRRSVGSWRSTRRIDRGRGGAMNDQPRLRADPAAGWYDDVNVVRRGVDQTIEEAGGLMTRAGAGARVKHRSPDARGWLGD